MIKDDETGRLAVHLRQDGLDARRRAEGIADDIRFRQLHIIQRFLLIFRQFAHKLDDQRCIFGRGEAYSHLVRCPLLRLFGHDATGSAYSAACPVMFDGRQRSTGLRAAAVSSRRRRGLSRGAPWK